VHRALLQPQENSWFIGIPLPVTIRGAVQPAAETTKFSLMCVYFLDRGPKCLLAPHCVCRPPRYSGDLHHTPRCRVNSVVYSAILHHMRPFRRLTGHYSVVLHYISRQPKVGNVRCICEPVMIAG